jgi:hypothetical protein
VNRREMIDLADQARRDAGYAMNPAAVSCIVNALWDHMAARLADVERKAAERGWDEGFQYRTLMAYGVAEPKVNPYFVAPSEAKS